MLPSRNPYSRWVPVNSNRWIFVWSSRFIATSRSHASRQRPPGRSYSLNSRHVLRSSLTVIDSHSVIFFMTSGHTAGSIAQKPQRPSWSTCSNRQHRRSSDVAAPGRRRSEEHTSELQSQFHLVCRLLLEKKKNIKRSLSLR